MKTLLCFVTIKRPVEPSVCLCVFVSESESLGENGGGGPRLSILHYFIFAFSSFWWSEHFFTLRSKLLRNKDRNYTIPTDKASKTKIENTPQIFLDVVFNVFMLGVQSPVFLPVTLKMAENAAKTYRQLNHGESPRKPKTGVPFHRLPVCRQNISLVSAANNTRFTKIVDQDASPRHRLITENSFAL